MNKRLIAVVLSALSPLAVQAASPQQTGPALDALPAAESAPAADAKPAASSSAWDRQCLRETGSRIKPRKNANGERPCLPLAGRSYSRDDVQRTGKTDVSEALRVLDPTIR